MKLLVLLAALLTTLAAAVPAPRPTTRKPASSAASPAVLLRKFDLAPLWLVSARPAEAQTMLGYMGPHYRPFNLVFEKVWRDSKNPGLYHVQGKSRERERLLPFSGTITLKSLKKVKAPYQSESFKALGHYQASGSFRLVESPAEEGAGTFTGTLLVAFSQTPQGIAYQPGRIHWWTEGEAGEGSKFTSTWNSVAHPAAIKLLWASNFMGIANTVLQDFSLGERGPSINRKYTRVGWQKFWDNEEWWAEAEEPAL
ncbi:hypothetical protein [Hymenobacter elongatus]|uniref:Uncharacterized protein n=1 Tax=Hymenobacter elongatus TaxID=877208 RepID=A0A4Z0PLV5_9BACT|nr:hypothetical protein [Hymenobacter elongatus]TGE16443.1 hypothetical protein E5J99_09970 [Hymenobacter elongatus]